jgi:integrase
MGKRGNGEGSISRRSGGGWMGQYVVHTAEGRRKRKTVYGKTRAKVATKLNKALSDREDGLVFDDEGLTVGEYLARWLRGSVRDTVRTSTYERNEQIVDLHVTPALGRLKLKSLTPAHVRWFYREKLDGGLSSATVHKMHVVLHKALAQAVRDGLIPRNATEAVKVPQVRRKEILPLSAEEAKRLLATAGEAGDRFEALYVLAVTTGLRQEELLALKWDDVDLEGGVLRVRRTLTRAKGTYTLGEPKTARSRRSVRLTEMAVEALRTHLARQLEEIDRVGSPYKDEGLVFATEKGTLVNPTNLRRRSFTPLLERAGLPQVRFHDLRHTCATLLLTKNVNPKVVSEMLGHASISITLDTYSHVLPNMQDSAARALEEALR